MEVILLEKIHKLGALGDKVNVRPGYGRNYLIPKRKAVPATAENVAKFEEQRAELERVQAEGVATAEARASKLHGIEVTIKANAGAEGKLFGSVGTTDIADAIIATGGDIEKSDVRLPQGPLREIGEYEVAVHIHADIDVQIKVKIIPDDVEPAA